MWNDANNVAYNEISTPDIPNLGDTNVVNFDVVIAAGDVQLKVIIDIGGGNNWAVKVTRNMIM